LPTYCCLEEWIEGEGNFAPPSAGFIDADGPDDDLQTYEDNDYHLTGSSPCVDAGKTKSWMWPAVDMDGNRRVFFGTDSLTVDVGAYEYGSSLFLILEVVEVEGETKLTWNSPFEGSYMIWSCLDLPTGEWIEEATVPAMGATSSWTDPDTGLRSKFYKISFEE
jgi:hypothetical protein